MARAVPCFDDDVVIDRAGARNWRTTAILLNCLPDLGAYDVVLPMAERAAGKREVGSVDFLHDDFDVLDRVVHLMIP